jgi:CDP-glycerol glycerophosphotransferase (TagB/SpsB family)
MNQERVPSIIGHIIVSALSYIVPKKKGYWAFVSFQFYGKYSGNNKALFEYFQNNKESLGEETQVVYVTNNKKTKNFIEREGYPVKYNKLLWLLPILRAEFVFVDGTRSFMGLGNFKFIQLWHGTGFKNIGLSFSGKPYSSVRHALLRRFCKNSLLICATSKDDQKRKAAAFESENVKITGSPRNDIFFQLPASATKASKRILYAPTFRDAGGSFSAMELKDWERIQILMERSNSEFLIKKHPSDYKLAVPTNMDRIIDVTKTTEDIQKLLASVDVLISDYSGISTDFAITGNPIIFYTYDYDNYIATCRSLYYDIKTTLPGPFASNADQLIFLLEDLSWFDEESYKVKYNQFRDTFHFYRDGNSSKRVLDEVINIKN